MFAVHLPVDAAAFLGPGCAFTAMTTRTPTCHAPVDRRAADGDTPDHAYVVAVWVASLLLAPAAHLNVGYAGAAFVLGGLFFAYAWTLLRDPSPRRAMKLFGFSITYLTALFVAMGADAVIRVH